MLFILCLKILWDTSFFCRVKYKNSYTARSSVIILNGLWQRFELFCFLRGFLVKRWRLEFFTLFPFHYLLKQKISAWFVVFVVSWILHWEKLCISNSFKNKFYPQNWQFAQCLSHDWRLYYFEASQNKQTTLNLVFHAQLKNRQQSLKKKAFWIHISVKNNCKSTFCIP